MNQSNIISRKRKREQTSSQAYTAASHSNFNPSGAYPMSKERQRPGISFLDFPPEVRLMIYRYCLIAPYEVLKPPSELQRYNSGWATPALEKNDEEINTIVQKHKAVHQSYISLRQSCTGAFKLELSPLRLSKTIHTEAASVLYGENEFQFLIGITRRHPHLGAPRFLQPPYYDYRDNLTILSDEYMRMIRKCTVEVRLPTFPGTSAKKMYLEYYGRLAAFAACFKGDDHSLERVAILFNRSFRKGYYFPLSCLRKSQNVLEPLAAIYGVRRSVVIGGGTPAFEAKLSSAMMSQAIAYVPKEEEYGVRTVKVKGKNRQQSYRLGLYYESKNLWDQSVLGRYPQHSLEAPPAYKCCEVCDEKPRLALS